MSQLIVMKFGGTSMGSAERIRIAASIASEQAKQSRVAIVVSAMSKVTDLLLDTLRHAESGDKATIEKNVASLRERHKQTASELLANPGPVLDGIDALVGEFERIAQGMLLLGDRPPRSVDEAIAIGERLTALMIAAYLNEQSAPSQAINAANVVVTDGVFGNATPIMDATRAKANALMQPLLAQGAIFETFMDAVALAFAMAVLAAIWWLL